MKRIARLLPLLLLSLALPVSAQSLDEQYVQVYNLILKGDRHPDSAQIKDSIASYSEAQNRLQRISQANPDWNAVVVNFRLKYLATQIEEQTERLALTRAEHRDRPARTVAPLGGHREDRRHTELPPPHLGEHARELHRITLPARQRIDMVEHQHEWPDKRSQTTE